MLKLRTRKKGLISIINGRIVDLPTPINITIWWNFGSMLGLVLITQITTGLFLSFHYCADIRLAFSSVDHITRDVNTGWLLRTLHSNGATFFFICIYTHIGRGLYYGSYLYVGTWVSGVVLLILLIAAAFMGYVLPWGQISFWGATVITNLFRAIPYFGDVLVAWLWGGFSVNNATLTRFYSLHFIVPMLLAGIVVLHLYILHTTGSNNPLGVTSSSDKIPFHWYFRSKDVVGFLVLLAALLFLVFFSPYITSEPDNFIIANPISTPAHIVPEWYFLFAYAILRAIPNKLGGVVGLFASILFLLTLPFTNKYALKGNAFYPRRKIIHWNFFITFVILTLAGSWPVEEPYVITSRLLSISYFSFFILHQPLRSMIDKVII